ncbi:hypothetical protein OUZ56_010690 [Daphnia magna]|uniref:Uncharacterized protein n=1 Tax=Daphnia magna TaxID=35525 RepID=A0ABQ9YYB6_9CRUS|nr:hypothetical protein OUZ56_010690 [Daphnia magna]
MAPLVPNCYSRLKKKTCYESHQVVNRGKKIHLNCESGYYSNYSYYLLAYYYSNSQEPKTQEATGVNIHLRVMTIGDFRRSGFVSLDWQRSRVPPSQKVAALFVIDLFRKIIYG